MKYFFLSNGWTVGRVWEFGGLWNESMWRRPPQIQRLNLCISERKERLWLYKVEDAVLMVEVKPDAPVSNDSSPNIGKVVLKRLISAEQAIEKLTSAQEIFNSALGKEI